MAFDNSNTSTTGDGYKTKSTRFVVGFGLVIDLNKDLPRKYDESVMGPAGGKGYVMEGQVVSVLGALDSATAPAVGDKVRVVVRPGDTCKAVFDDLEKTKEGLRFLLEGVTGNADALVARWAHGAGSNRAVKVLEIVGPPHVSFENPMPEDGPRNGYLRLNLDGSPTVFDEKRSDSVWVTREFTYDEVVGRLGVALDRNLRFRVSQRVLAPSLAILVRGQGELEAVLTECRVQGFTGCVVRSFIPGTVDADHVDVQVLSWPADIPAKGTSVPRAYDMPVLQETKRFLALRDGEAIASMEVVPGYVMDLIGNSDVEKSTKHKFVIGIVVKGLSDGQKALYGAQNYGPGISISAVNADGDVTGLLRLATRTEGDQYRSLMTIPTLNFADADKIVITAKNKGVAPMAG